MAIDTAQKRVSVTGVGRPWLRGIVPTASKNEPWRHTVGNSYAGFNLEDPGAGPAVADGRMTTIAKRFTRPEQVLG